MDKLSRDDLYSLEDYARIRPEFRSRVIAHKRDRRIPLGAHATLHFEDRLTIQYQVQEMLRIERIFESEGISDEMEAYNPLIPDGSNWKATFMIEYPDPEQRREALAKMLGVERRVWVKVGDHEPVYAIADEDLDRETEEKTSSVHFLRFELADDVAQAARDGAPVGLGCDHPEYEQTIDPLPEPTRKSLAADLS